MDEEKGVNYSQLYRLATRTGLQANGYASPFYAFFDALPLDESIWLYLKN